MKFYTVNQPPRAPFSEDFLLLQSNSKQFFLVPFNLFWQRDLVQRMLQSQETLSYVLVAILYLDESVRMDVLGEMLDQRKSRVFPFYLQQIRLDKRRRLFSIILGRLLLFSFFRSRLWLFQ